MQTGYLEFQPLEPLFVLDILGRQGSQLR